MYYRDTVHTITVTVTHYHDTDECKGHPYPDEDTIPDDVTYDVTHPDTCKPDERCWTADDVSDYAGDFLPDVTSVVRGYCWCDGPDYEGDWDGGFETEFEQLLHGPAPAYECVPDPAPTQELDRAHVANYRPRH